MSRIEQAFARMGKSGEKGLVVYLTAGDPNRSGSLAYLCGAAEGGADILEVGIPFSDPMADGPTIQAAFRRSLAGGMTTGRALSLVSSFRKKHDTPVVIFGYYNPFLQYGIRDFCRDARSAGADGILVVDLPLEEGGEMAPEAKRSGLDWIPLVSPTSGGDRVRRAAAVGSGFLYLISVTGITGARKALPPRLSEWTREVKAQSRLPVAVGFGISHPAMAKKAATHADAAVVGSACVRMVERYGTSRQGPVALRRFVQSLKKAMR
ncbi:MAG TPA: tryptophan synthase subunit alpha [Candidatus Deferrimicrobiaceae bacterium]|nr:tryptophan synthase subunit alpha [Candidatus Deferrimicrobiaceae bacterium]